MAEIADPQLTSFANEYLRPLADAMAKLDLDLTPTVEVYNSRNLGTIINDAGAGNLIDDGSAVDGRTRVTGGDVYNLITLINDFQAFITSGRRDVIYRWQVHSVR